MRTTRILKALAVTAQQQRATAQQQAATGQQQAAGCKPETRDGVEVQNCGGVTYRAAFRGNNLVYVVQ